MLETFFIVLCILLAASIGICAYLFALLRAKSLIIATQKEQFDQYRADTKERIAVEIAEKKEWQAIALRKDGQKPLGWTPPAPKEKDFVEIAPRVVHRSQLEARRIGRKPENFISDLTELETLEGDRDGEHRSFGSHPPHYGATPPREPNLKYPSVVEKVGEIVNNTK